MKRMTVFIAFCLLAACARACFTVNARACEETCRRTGVKVFTDSRCECQPERH